jgi:hypothetical protein
MRRLLGVLRNDADGELRHEVGPSGEFLLEVTLPWER